MPTKAGQCISMSALGRDTSPTRKRGGAATLLSPARPERRPIVALVALALISGWLLLPVGHATADDTSAPAKSADEGVTFFEKRIRPLFAERCHKCHGPEKQTSGLRLDMREGILGGGEHGAAIVPGKPDESLLITAVGYENRDLQMPPDKKLTDQQV